MVPVEACDPGPMPAGEGWIQWTGCEEPDTWVAIPEQGECIVADPEPSAPACDGVEAGPAACAWGCGWYRLPFDWECERLMYLCRDAYACEYSVNY